MRQRRHAAVRMVRSSQPPEETADANGQTAEAISRLRHERIVVHGHVAAFLHS